MPFPATSRSTRYYHCQSLASRLASADTLQPAPDTSAPAQQPSQTTPGAEATTPGSRNQGSAENLFAVSRYFGVVNCRS